VLTILTIVKRKASKQKLAQADDSASSVGVLYSMRKRSPEYKNKRKSWLEVGFEILKIVKTVNSGFYVLQQPDVMRVSIIDFPKGCSAKAW
jgi:hypothetical protein